jgi:hypothetical protein
VTLTLGYVIYYSLTGKSDNKSERMGKGQPNKKEKSKSKAKECIE